MKLLIIVIALLLSNICMAKSMWIETNYADAEYTALLEAVDIKESGFESPVFGFKPYYVEAKILDVYFGDIKENEFIDLLVYITPPFDWSLSRIKDKFILSFCRSNSGVFYTHRNYLIVDAEPDNIKTFKFVRQNGTDHEGSNDCSFTNYEDLNPDLHN